MSLFKEFWQARSCWRGNCKQDPRDKVVVEGFEVRYLLWGHRIAIWNQTDNTLVVDDCGWQTKLTFKRLNTLLYNLNLSIHSVHGVSCMWNAKQNTQHLWKSRHTINTVTNELFPNILRKTNPKLSQALRNYYTLALNTVAQHKHLITKTINGTICLFPKQYCNHHFQMPTLTLYLKGETLKAYTKEVASSKIYSAFMKNDATPVAEHLIQNGEELCGIDILSAIDEFSVNLNTLPSNMVKQLSLLRLVEA